MPPPTACPRRCSPTAWLTRRPFCRPEAATAASPTSISAPRAPKSAGPPAGRRVPAAGRGGVDRQPPAVEIHGVVHHREPQPVPRHVLIGAYAALEHPRSVGFRDAGPVVLHDEAEPLTGVCALVAPGRQPHPAATPF